MATVTPDPQQAGDFWVCPAVSDEDGSVRVSVAIAVEQPFDVQDTDVGVDLVAEGQSLALIERPTAGSLPVIQLVSCNAYALFSFANPENRVPQTVTITVRGGAATFDVSLPIV